MWAIPLELLVGVGVGQSQRPPKTIQAIVIDVSCCRILNEMSPLVLGIWTLGPRWCSMTGGGMSLGMGFEVSKTWHRSFPVHSQLSVWGSRCELRAVSAIMTAIYCQDLCHRPLSSLETEAQVNAFFFKMPWSWVLFIFFKSWQQKGN